MIIESITESDKEVLRHFLSNDVQVPDKDFNLVLSFLTKRTYKKGEIILKEGAVSSFNAFILNGMIHQYSVVDGTPFTINVAIPGMAMNSFISYFEQKPSYEIQQAIKDTTVLSLKREDTETLLRESHAFTLFYLLRYKWMHLAREKRAYILMHKSAARRFELFVDTDVRAPIYLKDVPQRMIASYLNLTPETYSRVKNEYLKKSDFLF